MECPCLKLKLGHVMLDLLACMLDVSLMTVRLAFPCMYSTDSIGSAVAVYMDAEGDMSAGP